MSNELESLKMIKELSNAFGPSGFEDDVLSIICKYVSDFGEIYEDSLRNLYLYRRENTGNKPVLMLDAHTDEVGLMIHSIKPNGTLKFVLLGGWNKSSLPSSKVLVRNMTGEYIPGIITTKPVHLIKTVDRRELNYEDADLCIDVGATSKEEAIEKFQIRIGEPVVPAIQFEYDSRNDLMFGKAFDCRIGCAALIETLNRLQGVELPFDIVGVFSAQEEVGDRGCKVAVNHVKPSVAFCFEGASADDTFVDAYAIQTGIRRGPMLRFMDHSIICNPRFMRYTLDLASKMKIPVQTSIRERGGNNGGIINTALDGVPVIVVAIPVRYIHSPNCLTTYQDFESTVKLAVSTIKSLNYDQVVAF